MVVKFCAAADKTNEQYFKEIKYNKPTCLTKGFSIQRIGTRWIKDDKI